MKRVEAVVTWLDLDKYQGNKEKWIHDLLTEKGAVFEDDKLAIWPGVTSIRFQDEGGYRRFIWEGPEDYAGGLLGLKPPLMAPVGPLEHEVNLNATNTGGQLTGDEFMNAVENFLGGKIAIKAPKERSTETYIEDEAPNRAIDLGEE